MTPDGAKPIEQLRPGDMVLSSPEDDANGPVAARRVEEVFHRDHPLYDVQVGDRLIRTTPEHPFYVQGKGWTVAKSLIAGDLLRSHDNRWLPVESSRASAEAAPVYNLRVEEDHTYFVGSPDWGFSVWVHNACGDGKIIEEIKKSKTALENALKSGDPAAIQQAQRQLDEIRRAQQEFWNMQRKFLNDPDMWDVFEPPIFDSQGNPLN